MVTRTNRASSNMFLNRAVSTSVVAAVFLCFEIPNRMVLASLDSRLRGNDGFFSGILFVDLNLWSRAWAKGIRSRKNGKT